MANIQKGTKKLEDMTPEERKVYNEKAAEHRKTPEFFKDTAEKRTQKVIKSLKTLGFMGKYNGTDEQNENIINAVDNAVDDMKSALLQESKKKTAFKL